MAPSQKLQSTQVTPPTSFDFAGEMKLLICTAIVFLSASTRAQESKAGTDPTYHHLPAIYEVPHYRAPIYEPPIYKAPNYEAPIYRAPHYETPSYLAPYYQPAGYLAPNYEPASYKAPDYEPPHYRAPEYQAARHAASSSVHHPNQSPLPRPVHNEKVPLHRVPVEHQIAHKIFHRSEIPAAGALKIDVADENRTTSTETAAPAQDTRWKYKKTKKIELEVTSAAPVADVVDVVQVPTENPSQNHLKLYKIIKKRRLN